MIKGGLAFCVIKNVITVPLGITVSTTAVAIVLINLHVTNKLDTAIGDVIQDILLKTATKFVHLDILEWTVLNAVAVNV